MKYGAVSGDLEDPHGNRLHSEIFADAGPVRTVCLFLLFFFFFCITVITPLIAAGGNSVGLYFQDGGGRES